MKESVLVAGSKEQIEIDKIKKAFYELGYKKCRIFLNDHLEFICNFKDVSVDIIIMIYKSFCNKYIVNYHSSKSITVQLTPAEVEQIEKFYKLWKIPMPEIIY